MYIEPKDEGARVVAVDVCIVHNHYANQCPAKCAYLRPKVYQSSASLRAESPPDLILFFGKDHSEQSQESQ